MVYIIVQIKNVIIIFVGIKVKVNNLFCDKTKGNHITDLRWNECLLVDK